MIKIFLRKLLIRILQPIGFYVTYYASAGRVYNSLCKFPLTIQEYELKRIFDTVAIAKNHKFHNRLLEYFTNDWKLNVLDAKFIGIGSGESSLSSFRKVYIDGMVLHEKIYFSSHQDLKSILWFYKNFSGLVQKYGIVLPRFFEIYPGEAISVFYTEFLKLSNLKTLNKDISLIEISQKLYKLSLTDEFNEISEKTTSIFKDYRKHFEYKRNRPAAKDLFENYGIKMESIEFYVLNCRHILTHGDIQDTNTFDNGIIIDWDSVGIFPIGFDPAFIFFYLLLKNEYSVKVDIILWLNTHYKKIIDASDWECFQLSFLFFLFVFIQQRLDKDKQEYLSPILIGLIKKYKQNEDSFYN